MQGFSSRDTLNIVIVTLAGVVSSILLKWYLLIGFLPGFLFVFYSCVKKGHPTKKITKSASEGFLKTKEIMIILCLVGILLPSWDMAGTIDQMVYLILSNINPSFFYISAFSSTFIISMILGTSVGSLSSIGIPLIGAAMSIGMSVEVTAGALVSGAFVGDRTSPFSSANQLLSHTIELERKLFQRSLWKTGSIGLVFSSIFFLYFDITKPSGATVFTNVDHFKWYLILPAVSLVICAIIKLKIRYCFLISIVVALIITVIMNGFFLQIIINLWEGTNQTGGGLQKILPLIAFIGLAGAYNGMIEEFSIFQPLLTKWLGPSSSLSTMTRKTMFATLIITMLGCNQTIPIILTGRSFLSEWDVRQNKREFARVMADSSMLFAGMVPWSVLAIMCSTVLGVPLFDYLPYAIFIWCLPIITMLYSYIYSKMSKEKSMSH
ncbi:Na+/H+ antiporter NhaC family protein [Bacillus salitolerans]|uniref:Na+/H+ antiporter NhaC family protein n=1 Tax=Bacillus salitolerans TaxID=1437434 RepID=A0ABW4LJJ9_9BACI